MISNRESRQLQLSQMIRVSSLSLAILALAACGSPRGERARPPATAGVVDSAMPVESALARFRARVGARPDGLRDAAPSPDSLVRSVAGALARNDTTALIRAALSPAEFAYFYYPADPQARPPYELPPQIMWLQLSTRSDKGLGRLLGLLGGHRIDVLAHRCDAPEPHGPERVLAHCTVTYRVDGDSARTDRLFAAILERGGQYKILSFANDF